MKKAMPTLVLVAAAVIWTALLLVWQLPSQEAVFLAIFR